MVQRVPRQNMSTRPRLWRKNSGTAKRRLSILQKRRTKLTRFHIIFYKYIYFYNFFDLTGWLMVQPVRFYHQSIYLAKCIRKTYSLLGFGVSRPMNRDEPRLTATVTGWFMLAIIVSWMEITMQKKFYENSFNFR